MVSQALLRNDAISTDIKKICDIFDFSSAVYAALNSKPVKIAHYTTIQGLLGILGNNDLWLSHAMCLNDKHEIRDGLRIAKNVAKGENLEIDEESAINTNYYVFSFAQYDGAESLGQWRSYANDGKGICLVFESSALLEYFESFFSVMNTQNCQASSFNVIYDDDHKRSIFETLLRVNLKKKDVEQLACVLRNIGVVGGFAMGSVWGAVIGGVLGTGLGKLLTSMDEDCVTLDENQKTVFREKFTRELLRGFLPKFKNPAFAEEKEYRLVVSDAQSRLLDNQLVKFRSSGERCIPYISTKEIMQKECGGLEPRPIPISEIIIGPVSDKMMLKQAVGLLKKSCGRDDLVVTDSNIPYRSSK